MENVTPVAFESTWNDDMEMWGQQIKCAVEGVVAMVSVGLGVGQDTLIEAGKYGPRECRFHCGYFWYSDD